jgi:hypothetical protein
VNWGISLLEEPELPEPPDDPPDEQAASKQLPRSIAPTVDRPAILEDILLDLGSTATPFDPSMWRTGDMSIPKASYITLGDRGVKVRSTVDRDR